MTALLPGVLAHMSRQHGLITRPQALEAGMSREQVDRLVRLGAWAAPHRGVYAESAVVAEATANPRDRRLLRDRAASLRITGPHVPSHDFAALELGIPLHVTGREFTHVTRAGIVGSHLRHGVKHHLAPYVEEQLHSVEGRTVLGPARTAIDLAREHGLDAGVVGIDAVRRSGVRMRELRAVVDRMVSWPHLVVVRQALELSDPGSESLGESLSRLVVVSLGHGVPETQFGLHAEGRTVWCDLRLHRHVFEFDGKVKYQRRSEGGFAMSSPEDAVWHEKQRQDFVCGFKLGMSRITYADLFGAARMRLAQRLVREYLDTCARFGTDISDLEPYRVRTARPPRPLAA